MVDSSWLLTLKGSEYEAAVEDVQKYADVLKGRGALPRWAWQSSRDLVIICFQMFGVWQILRWVLPSTFLWIWVQEYLGWNLIALLMIHLHYTDQNAALEKILGDWEILGALQFFRKNFFLDGNKNGIQAPNIFSKIWNLESLSSSFQICLYHFFHKSKPDSTSLAWSANL